MRTIIVGAGVAGLAAARAALNAGHEVQVLDSARHLRTGDGAVTVFSNGFAALAGLGIDATDLGGEIERMDFRSGAGQRLARVDLGALRRASGFPVRCVPRAALLERLAASLPDDVLHFGSRVVFGRVADDHVHVTDACGTVRSADVVVGADGHRSAIRRTFVDRLPAKASGWVTWQGLGRALPEVAAGTTGYFRVGAEGFVGIMPAGGGRVLWWFDMPVSSLPSGDPSPGDLPPDEQERGPSADLLRRRFGGYPAPVGALLEQLTDADITPFTHVRHRVPNAWGSGPVTLAGDAAHAFPPTQAQGANQAMEDALVLARVLDRGSDPEPALRRYERARRRRVRRVSRLAASETTNRLPAAPLRLAQAAIPPALAGRGYLALLRQWSNVL